MLYIIIALMIFLGHDGIPLADTLARAADEFMGGAGAPTGEMPDVDPLVAAVVALPYWVAIKIALSMLSAAGNAEMGGEPKGGDKE
jgi:hypothetical protein